MHGRDDTGSDVATNLPRRASSICAPQLVPAADGAGAVLVWRLPEPMLAISSAPLGGGLGVRRWVLNAQVAPGYDRLDPETHLAALAASLGLEGDGLEGDGVGLLTAADVDQVRHAVEAGVRVDATVGLAKPTWAAAKDDETPLATPAAAIPPGTVNIVVSVPERIADAGLVNLVATVTEAKTQALLDLGVPGTGTATDAVCVLCPRSGPADPFGGPRSTWGAPTARAVYRAVAEGAVASRHRRAGDRWRDAEVDW